MANWLSRILPSRRKRAAEGEYRPGPYLLSDGWLSASAGRRLNWWQNGHSLQPYGDGGAMVEACVSAYAQTIAMCPGDHWRKLENGGRERVSGSALTRVLKRPNSYESISDFLMNLTRSLYKPGEAFAFAVRNERGEIKELHRMSRGYPHIAADGSIFYSLSGNPIAEQLYNLSAPVPARDVLHIRLHTPRHPLKGEGPIVAAAVEMAMSSAAMAQQVTFYLNQARPSFMLETDQKLTRDQATELRQMWEEQTTGQYAGGSPILTSGLKAKAVNISASDGQLVEMLKMTEQNIALAFRMPLQILGLGGTTFASTELLMQSWIASGLGFALNHIEEAIGLLFGLKGMPDEYLEFDTRALLRSAYKDQIEALRNGVIGGIYSPDEARAMVDLPAVAGGHGAMPRVQQQVVPLSYGTDMKPPAVAAPPVAPTDTPAQADPARQDEADDGQWASADDILQRLNAHASLH